MLSGLMLIGFVVGIGQSIKEAREPRRSANWKSDQKKYDRDLFDDNLSMMDIVRRQEKGYYMHYDNTPPVDRTPTNPYYCRPGLVFNYSMKSMDEKSGRFTPEEIDRRWRSGVYYVTPEEYWRWQRTHS